MNAAFPIIRWPVVIAFVTLAFVMAPVGALMPADASVTPGAAVGPEPQVKAFVAPQPSAGDVAVPTATPTDFASPPPDDDAAPVLGIAEPGGSLPRVTDPNRAAAWHTLRYQLEGSGVCWLRTDMTPRLADAIGAFSWLGGPGTCGTAGEPQVKLVAILDDQTMWSAERLCPTLTFSDIRRARRNQFTLSDWGLVVRCVATAFKGRISAYEIWNEPLLPNSAYGYQDGSARHYVEMLRTAHDAIKAVDPNATVIALGGSDLYAGGQGAARLARMRQFSEELVRLGAAEVADAISLHAYPWGAYGDTVRASYEAELTFHRDLWGKPVWITETGHRANERGNQADYLVAASCLFLEAGVGHVFWFAMSDQPDGEFGIEGRPAQAALRDLALGQAGVRDAGDCALDGPLTAER